MPNFLSPRVISQEQDSTLYVTTNSNSVGGLAGGFQWGPVDFPTLITGGEKDFINQFQKPNNAVAKYVMPVLDFLSYTQQIWIVRQVGPTAVNAFPGAQTAQLIKNENAFSTAELTGTDFIAKFPGSLGNGITVDICDSTNFPTWEFNNKFQYTPQAGQYAVAVVDASGAWTGAGAVNQTEQLSVIGTSNATGNISVFGIEVAILSGDTASVVAGKIAATSGFAALFSSVSVSGAVITYVSLTSGYKVVHTAPATVDTLTFATSLTNPGRIGTPLETYELLTNTPGTTMPDGTPTYWVTAINQSAYVYACDPTIAPSFRTVVMAGGVDDYTINTTSGIQELSNKEAYPLQFLISPDVTAAEQLAIIGVATTRGDCMPFVAPPMAAVVNNKGNEVAAVNAWRSTTLGIESNYSFAVDNWGYMFDKYNNVYRWVPATGGTAGVAARSFSSTFPWVPFAGNTRGVYLNYTKVAWSAAQSDRDALYPNGINSIVNFPNQGITLWGDRTLTAQPTSFSRTNVRWAFIVAEQSLTATAKYYLFENNTAFTRAQFVNAATPFLRNMVGNGAFSDFQIICDTSNNTTQTQQTNQMVVQILLKPVFSINWVVMTFDAVSLDVSFSTATA